MSAYIDGRLTAAERETVQQHLAACDQCVEEVRQIRAVATLLHSCPQVVPPRSFALKPDMVERRGFVARLSLYAPLATALAAMLLVALVFADARVLTPRLASPAQPAPAMSRAAEPTAAPAAAVAPESESEPLATFGVEAEATAPAAEAVAAPPPEATADGPTESLAVASEDAAEGEAAGAQEKVAAPMVAPEEPQARAAGDRAPAGEAEEATPEAAALTQSVPDEPEAVDTMPLRARQATPAWRWALRGAQGALVVVLLGSAVLWLGRLSRRRL